MGFEQYINARDATIRNGERARAEQNAMQMQGVQREAGGLIASGDMTGGANALLNAGDIDGGLSVYAGQRQQQTADRTRQRAAVLAAAQGLKRVPMTERGNVFQTTIAPVFEAEGLGEVLGQISPEMMDDASLESLIVALGGEIESPYANDRAGPNGSVLRPGADGTYAPVYTAPVDPLETEYQRARIDALYAQGRQRDASAGASNARAGATRARSSGGGSASRSAPRAAAPSGRPWERSW